MPESTKTSLARNSLPASFILRPRNNVAKSNEAIGARWRLGVAMRSRPEKDPFVLRELLVRGLASESYLWID